MFSLNSSFRLQTFLFIIILFILCKAAEAAFIKTDSLLFALIINFPFIFLSSDFTSVTKEKMSIKNNKKKKQNLFLQLLKNYV